MHMSCLICKHILCLTLSLLSMCVGEADYSSAGPYIGGPHITWKAFLKPAPAGGNVTISAVCTGCTEDGSFSNINISNVVFGDVWHCSYENSPSHHLVPLART